MSGHRRPNERRFSMSFQRRRGAVIIAALACLLIVVAVVGAMLKNAVLVRRQLRAERDRRQTELLVEAGADRAAALLAKNPVFRGDTWDVPADASGMQGAGRVTSSASRTADGKSWLLHIVAEYPLDRDFLIRRSQTISIASANPSQE